MAGAVVPFALDGLLSRRPGMERDLRELRAWLRTQPHLPEEQITDQDLALVLGCCEAAAARRVLDAHCTLRTEYTGLFGERRVDADVEESLRVMLVAPLPTRTADGRKVIYARLLDAAPARFSLRRCARAFVMALDLQQLEEGPWPGLVVALDLDGVSFGHLLRLDATTIRHGLRYLQEALFAKLELVHFLRAPWFTERLLALLRPGLAPGLAGLLRPRADAALPGLPAHALPRELGGEYKDFASLRDEMLQRMRDNGAYFAHENLRRVREHLRPAAPAPAAADVTGR